MKSTNRTWQRHLHAKGIFPFFLDRLQQHALSSQWQHQNGAFDFGISDRESEDELSRAYFEFIEAFPYEFYLEITNFCNLNCEMCARRVMSRSEGVMSFGLFSKIIDEIAEKQPHAFIHYYGIGESMVDKRLFEKLAYSRRKGLRNSLLFTNGQLLLHKENYKRLAEAGLTSIGVDVDAMCPETYEKIRIGGKFETTKRGVELLYGYIREKGLRTRVELAYQIVPGVNENEIAPFVSWCDANRYEYKLVTMHDWAGMRSDVGQTKVAGLAEMHHTPRQNPCPFLWNGFTIAWDGRVPVCFQDADVRDSMGDLNDQSIEEVWVNSCRQRRARQVRGEFDGICSQCISFTSVRLPEFRSALYPECLLQPQESVSEPA